MNAVQRRRTAKMQKTMSKLVGGKRVSRAKSGTKRQQKDLRAKHFSKYVGIGHFTSHTNVYIVRVCECVCKRYKSGCKNGTLIMSKMEKSWKIIQKKNGMEWIN